MTAQEKALAHAQQRGVPGKALRTIHETLFSQKTLAQIKNALPKHLTPERAARIAFSTISRNNDLMSCSVPSLIKAVIEASELGLELTGPLGHAYLVPYKKNVQMLIGYRGFIELAYRSGKIITIYADVVYDDDDFEFEFGINEKLRHRPKMLRTENSKPIASYAYAHFIGGGHNFQVLSVDQIEKIRRSSHNNSSEYSPWLTNWDEMAKKTAIRRLAKYLPMSPETTAAAVTDELRELTSETIMPAVTIIDTDTDEKQEENVNGT